METGFKIGCEAYIIRDARVLLGKRKNTFGAGTWGLPGGHLHFKERAADCLIRELDEEINVTVKPSDLKLIAVTDGLLIDGEGHYIHLTFQVDIGNQEPELAEPDFCEEWEWFPVDKLPKEIFPPHIKILETIKSQKIYLP